MKLERLEELVASCFERGIASSWLVEAALLAVERETVAPIKELATPAWKALEAIDASPNDMAVRRHAEIAAFYAMQRIRSLLTEE